MGYNLAQFTKFKIEDHIHAPQHSGNIKHFYNHFWIVTPDDEVMRWRKTSFQCNPNKNVVDLLIKNYEGCRVEQIEHMWFEVDEDYYG